MVWIGTQFYEGYFKEGKFHGKGKLELQDGSWYDGDWVRGRKQGKGTHRIDQEHLYEGEFMNDKKHGQGTMSTCTKESGGISVQKVKYNND